MTCAHEMEKFGVKKQPVLTNKMQSVGGMGFESRNSVVFLLFVLLSKEVTLIALKEVFVVVCETSFHWCLCCLNEQQICNVFWVSAFSLKNLKLQ